MSAIEKHTHGYTQDKASLVKRLHRIEDFTRFVANQPSGNLALLVRRGRSDFYVPVDLTSAAPRPPEGLPRFLPPSKDTLLRT